MFVGAGIVLWLFMGIVLAYLFGRSLKERPLFYGEKLGLVVLIFVSAALFFRPHQEIWGGQDTGAYINMAGSFAKYQSFRYTDPLLSQVPPSERSPFFTMKHYPSKYQCMCLDPDDLAIVQPWFQPAFSVVCSPFVRWGGASGVLYVGPLMVLGLTLLMYCLGRQLFPHPFAGLVCGFIYTITPLIVWHARFTRPEFAASFLLIAGLLLAVRSLGEKGRAVDVVLAALCMGLAPFFHITAWITALATAIMMLVTIMMIPGKRLLLYHPVVMLLFALFAVQVFTVCDTYGLRRFLAPFQSLFLWAPLLFLTVTGVIALLSGRIASCRMRIERQGRWIGVAMALICLTWLVLIYVHASKTVDLVRPTGLFAYLYRTDLVCFIRVMSRGAALLSCLGLVLLCVRPTGRFRRLFFLLCTFPAVCLVGNMTDFFETRYQTVMLLPFAVVCLTAVVTAATWRRIRGKIYLPVALAVIAYLMIHGRTKLIETKEYKGLVSLFDDVAQLIPSNGMVLGEYSRFIAPLEMLWGIDALPLDNEQHDDYGQAEKTWSELMEKNPQRPAFFVTPFSNVPISPYFDFTKVKKVTRRVKYLEKAPRTTPTVRKPWQIDVYVYEMHLKSDSSSHIPQDAPVKILFDSGNMGVRGYEYAQHPHHLTFTGYQLTSDAVRFGAMATTNPAADIMVLFQHAADQGNALKSLKINGRPVDEVYPLNDGWYVAISSVQAESEGIQPLALTADGSVALAMGARLFEHGEIKPWRPKKGCVRSLFDAPGFTTRWAQRRSRLVLPSQNRPQILLTCMEPHPQWGDQPIMEAIIDDIPQPQTLRSNEMQWTIWPVIASANATSLLGWGVPQTEDADAFIAGFGAVYLLDIPVFEKFQ
ncbi:MAG: hypothetical protein EOL87_02535 [Spartobacteria bacterium]|nr:hypothetical protein [Spartobacteria bacterium]